VLCILVIQLIEIYGKSKTLSLFSDSVISAGNKLQWAFKKQEVESKITGLEFCKNTWSSYKTILCRQAVRFVVLITLESNLQTKLKFCIFLCPFSSIAAYF